MTARREGGAFSGWYAAVFSGRAIVWVFALVWAGLVIFPLGLLVVYSFLKVQYFQMVWEPGLDTWQALFDSGRWLTAVRTLRIALTVTVIELLVAYPFALWLAKGCRSQRVKAMALALLTIPFFLDLSSRTIVFRPVLGQNGLINTVLLDWGLIDQPISWLLYSEFAVHLGMLAPYFPTMVLPIFLVMTFIDDDLLQASADLGARPLETLAYVIVPLSLPGVIAGVIFTLGPTLAAWIEPSMLGGGFVNMLSQSVESAYTTLNYPIVAALSTFVVFLLAVLLVVLVLMFSRRGSAAGEVFAVMRQ